MKPWVLVDSAKIPQQRAPGQDRELSPGGELRLYCRDGDYSIRVNNWELMNSRAHGSEEALAQLGCGPIAERAQPRVLIGGLGMGFTLAETLRALPQDAEVVVSELTEAVIRWNRGPLEPLAGAPLKDPRSRVRNKDIATILKAEKNRFDAILLDVDNGPGATTRKENGWLYSRRGLCVIGEALRDEGVVAVWSTGDSPGFTSLCRQLGYEVESHRVRAHEDKGSRYIVWVARKRPGWRPPPRRPRRPVERPRPKTPRELREEAKTERARKRVQRRRQQSRDGDSKDSGSKSS